MISGIIGHWVPIILILLIISFALGDNPLWRFAETIAIGAGLGNSFVYEMNVVQRTALTPLMNGKFIMILPLLFGLILYCRFVPKYDWVSRYGFIWIIAGTLGVGVGSIFQGTILPGLIETIKIVGPTPIDTMWKILQLFIFVTTWSYFIFTKPHTGILGKSSRIGRIWMMMALGVGYSTIVEQYSYLVIERIWFILDAVGLI